MYPSGMRRAAGLSALCIACGEDVPTTMASPPTTHAGGGGEAKTRCFKREDPSKPQPFKTVTNKNGSRIHGRWLVASDGTRLLWSLRDAKLGLDCALPEESSSGNELASGACVPDGGDAGQDLAVLALAQPTGSPAEAVPHTTEDGASLWLGSVRAFGSPTWDLTQGGEPVTPVLPSIGRGERVGVSKPRVDATCEAPADAVEVVRFESTPSLRPDGAVFAGRAVYRPWPIGTPFYHYALTPDRVCPSPKPGVECDPVLECKDLAGGTTGPLHFRVSEKCDVAELATVRVDYFGGRLRVLTRLYGADDVPAMRPAKLVGTKILYPAVFDAQMGMQGCAPALAAGGGMRCLPTTSTNGRLLVASHYVDAECMQPIVMKEGFSDLAAKDTANGRAIHRLGADVTPTELYVRNGGSCDAVPVPAGILFAALGDEITSQYDAVTLAD